LGLNNDYADGDIKNVGDSIARDKIGLTRPKGNLLPEDKVLRPYKIQKRNGVKN